MQREGSESGACCSPVVCFQDAEKAGLNASAASRGHRVSARGTAQGWIRGGSRRPAGAPSPSRPPRQGGVEAPSRRLGQLGGRRPGCPGFWYARPVQTRAVESASARLAKRPPSSREPGESRAAARAPARPPGRPLPPRRPPPPPPPEFSRLEQRAVAPWRRPPSPSICDTLREPSCTVSRKQRARARWVRWVMRRRDCNASQRDAYPVLLDWTRRRKLLGLRA